MTHNSGKFKQVLAALARVPNIFPAFDLTLMTVERRRTQVFLKVVKLRLGVRAEIHLDSYHAYIEDVTQGILETYKKAIKIRMGGEFSFTVVHQEESLTFTFFNKIIEALKGKHLVPSEGSLASFETGIHREIVHLDGSEHYCVELPIDKT